MKIPVWVVEHAADFWRDAAEAGCFPRDLRGSIPRAVPLSVFVIADLSLCRMQQWLEENGIVCEMAMRDRRLRAGLAAQNGCGIAFIDGTDSDEEQRYSLAHELAHFLKDYWRPRRQVETRLGPNALQAYDGLRPATADERFQSMLRFAPMGFFLHLLARTPDGEPASANIATVEEDADRLAFELLAPAEHIISNIPNWRDPCALRAALVDVYGFPEQQAMRYTAALLPPKKLSDPLLRTLKISR